MGSIFTDTKLLDLMTPEQKRVLLEAEVIESNTFSFCMIGSIVPAVAYVYRRRLPPMQGFTIATVAGIFGSGIGATAGTFRATAYLQAQPEGQQLLEQVQAVMVERRSQMNRQAIPEPYKSRLEAMHQRQQEQRRQNQPEGRSSKQDMYSLAEKNDTLGPDVPPLPAASGSNDTAAPAADTSGSYVFGRAADENASGDSDTSSEDAWAKLRQRSDSGGRPTWGAIRSRGRPPSTPQSEKNASSDSDGWLEDSVFSGSGDDDTAATLPENRSQSDFDAQVERERQANGASYGSDYSPYAEDDAQGQQQRAGTSRRRSGFGF